MRRVKLSFFVLNFQLFPAYCLENILSPFNYLYTFIRNSVHIYVSLSLIFLFCFIHSLLPIPHNLITLALWEILQIDIVQNCFAVSTTCVFHMTIELVFHKDPKLGFWLAWLGLYESICKLLISKLISQIHK